jgi:hypothetical protein
MDSPCGVSHVPVFEDVPRNVPTLWMVVRPKTALFIVNDFPSQKSTFTHSKNHIKLLPLLLIFHQFSISIKHPPHFHHIFHSPNYQQQSISPYFHNKTYNLT